MSSDDTNSDIDLDADEIPVLTEVADAEPEPARHSFQVLSPESIELDGDRLAELEAELVTRTHDLADQLIHSAFEQMEAAMFEEVSNRLKSELPDLIDKLLREYLRSPDVSEDG